MEGRWDSREDWVGGSLSANLETKSLRSNTVGAHRDLQTGAQVGHYSVRGWP